MTWAPTILVAAKALRVDPQLTHDILALCDRHRDRWAGDRRPRSYREDAAVLTDLPLHELHPATVAQHRSVSDRDGEALRAVMGTHHVCFLGEWALSLRSPSAQDASRDFLAAVFDRVARADSYSVTGVWSALLPEGGPAPVITIDPDVHDRSWAEKTGFVDNVLYLVRVGSPELPTT